MDYVHDVRWDATLADHCARERMDTRMPEWRLLWVDTQPEVLDPARCLLQAHRITVRCVPDYETALGQVQAWVPHVLLLDYGRSAKGMHYETFVYEELPLVDPYGAGGQLFDNPWCYTAIPILLATGGLPATVPGYVTPHLTRVAYFLPKPCHVSHLVQRVQDLLRIPPLGLTLEPHRRRVWIQGTSHSLPPRELDILLLLAHSHPKPLTAPQLVRRLHDDKGIRSNEAQVRVAIHRMRQILETEPTKPQLLWQRRARLLPVPQAGLAFRVTGQSGPIPCPHLSPLGMFERS